MNQNMQNKQTNAREADRPALSSPSDVITIIKGLLTHENKEQGKTWLIQQTLPARVKENR